MMEDSAKESNQELKFLQEVLNDEELALTVSQADDEAAVVLLLNFNFVVAVKLRRDRTGNSLRDAVDAVEDISKRRDLF